MTGNLAKCKQFLPSLQRAGRMQVIRDTDPFSAVLLFCGGGEKRGEGITTLPKKISYFGGRKIRETAREKSSTCMV
jgi:hypothetical protein